MSVLDQVNMFLVCNEMLCIMTSVLVAVDVQHDGGAGARADAVGDRLELRRAQREPVPGICDHCTA